MCQIFRPECHFLISIHSETAPAAEAPAEAAPAEAAPATEAPKEEEKVCR